jgi:DNA-binding XRE family transcriptional regulator
MAPGGLAHARRREVTGRKPAVEAPIPNRIAELRERAGLSRVELAARVDVNPQTIGYLERGEYNPSLVLAFRLGELFGLPIERVLLRGDARERECRP